MFIEFSVENYKSIKDEAKLSLVATPAREHLDTHVIKPEQSPGLRNLSLLRSAAIFGPNAAGKSNLIRALNSMQKIVGLSTRLNFDLPVTPFLFDSNTANKPTTFEIVGCVNQMRFQYGFSVTKDLVKDEWLYAWPKGRQQRWFERSTTTSNEVNCNFGEKLLGDKEIWRKATRPNSLFLTTAVTLNSKQLEPIYNWFSKKLHVGGPGDWGRDYSAKWCEGERKDEIVNFIRSADIEIDDLRVSEKDIIHEQISPLGPSFMKWRGRKDLFTKHQTRQGHLTELNLEDESDGTQKIFEFAGPWIDTLENGHVIVYDELHENLHPVLLKFLINQFHDKKKNKLNAQLIFTTHDTSILSQEMLRRDQIWFCERNSNQETELFPLTTYSPRRRFENLERSYLGGRYGALPYLDLYQNVEV